MAEALAAAKAPPSSSVGATSFKKSRPVQRDLRVELCGRNDDPVYLKCFHLLRSYRHRYHPLIRPYYTAVGGPAIVDAEEDLSGKDNANDSTTDARSQVGSSSATNVADLSLAAKEDLTLSRHFNNPNTAAISVEGAPFLDRLHPNSNTPTSSSSAGTASGLGEEWLRHFLDYKLLGLKIRRTYEQHLQEHHAAAQPIGGSTTDAGPSNTLSMPDLHENAAWPLFVRHYVDEGSRTASFIIAHLVTKVAVVVDPPLDLTRLQHDLTQFGLCVRSIFLTQLYMDVRTGHKALQRLHPSCQIVWCGSVWPTVATRGTAAAVVATSHDNEEVAPNVNNASCAPVQAADDNEEGAADRSVPTAAAPITGVHIGDALWTMDLGPMTAEWPAASAAQELPSLWVRGVWSPAGTDDAMMLELHIGSIRVALFAGTTFPLDGCVRHDLRKLVPSASMTLPSGAANPSFPWQATNPSREHEREAPVFMSRKQQQQQSAAAPVSSKPVVSAENTKLHATISWLIEEYFGGTLNHRRDLDGVVVFPSHGGYNHMTHQLDLYWAAHVADLKRYSHVKKVYELVMATDAPGSTIARGKAPPAVNDAKSSVSKKKGNGGGNSTTTATQVQPIPRPPAIRNLDGYIKALPLLPKCFTFDLNRAANLKDIYSNTSVGDAAAVTTAVAPFAPGGLVVDVRPFHSYATAHIPGSINIPMTFPGFTFGAKKAELWLSCTLGPSTMPGAPITVVCAVEAEVNETKLRCMHVGIPPEGLHVVSVERLGAIAWKAVATITPQSTSRGTTTTIAPGSASLQQSAVGRNDTQDASWKRLNTIASLDALSIVPTTLVVDVRTPYEYKNGSHRSSVHYALADLCTAFAAPASVSSSLALRLLSRLHDDAIVGGAEVAHRLEDIQRVVMYCAAGYRSHIAVSIIKAALEQEALAPAQRGEASKASSVASSLADIDVVDVAGGALHIMLHRPDVWLVKDRSIICIS